MKTKSRKNMQPVDSARAGLVLLYLKTYQNQDKKSRKKYATC